MLKSYGIIKKKEDPSASQVGMANEEGFSP